MSGAPAVLDPRRAWLAERRRLITASDVPAILGADPHRGPLAVWAEKVGEIEAEETLPMRRGRRFEDAIAEEYGEQTDRPIWNLGAYEIQRHPAVPWLGATLDRVTSIPSSITGTGEPAKATLQLKMALGSAADWKDGPPLGHLVQVTIEAVCYRATWGALAGLLGPEPLRVSDHRLNEEFLAAAMPVLEAFRLRVERRDPPEADALPGTSAAIRRLWAEEDGETVALDHEALALADELDRARALHHATEGDEELLQNKLRRRIGAATFGALPDGSYLTLKTTDRDGYTVQPTTYRALRRWQPRLRRR